MLLAEIVHRLRIVAWLILLGQRTFRAMFIAGTCNGPTFQVPAVP